jgi:hypothetical protein
MSPYGHVSLDQSIFFFFSCLLAKRKVFFFTKEKQSLLIAMKRVAVMQPMRFAGVAAVRTNAWGLAVPRLSTVAQRRWTSSAPSTEDRATAVDSAPKEGEGEEKMTPNAYKQEAAFRKDPIQPYIDARPRDPLYNPVVDDWVDFNNPRWKVQFLLFFSLICQPP